MALITCETVVFKINGQDLQLTPNSLFIQLIILKRMKYFALFIHHPTTPASSLRMSASSSSASSCIAPFYNKFILRHPPLATIFTLAVSVHFIHRIKASLLLMNSTPVSIRLLRVEDSRKRCQIKQQPPSRQRTILGLPSPLARKRLIVL